MGDFEASKINHDNHLLLVSTNRPSRHRDNDDRGSRLGIKETNEYANHPVQDQPLLRLPYELLRKNFRSAHFVIEKESSQVKTLLKESATGSLNGKSSPEDVLKNLDGMLSRMRGLKRKLSACVDEEARLYRQLDARTSHLAELSEMHTVDDVRYQAWSRQRLDRLMVDYMLRHGYSDSAVAMAEQKGMQDLVDIDTFMSMNKIRKALENGSVTEALAWCTENKKELRKMDVRLPLLPTPPNP